MNLIGVGDLRRPRCLAIIFVQMWLRWTLPRPRIDQVLYACVKVLLPMACVLLLGAALLAVADRPSGRAIPWRRLPTRGTSAELVRARLRRRRWSRRSSWR